MKRGEAEVVETVRGRANKACGGTRETDERTDGRARTWLAEEGRGRVHNYSSSKMKKTSVPPEAENAEQETARRAGVS